MEDIVRDAVDAVIPVVDAIGAFIIVVGVGVAFLTWAMSELRIRYVPYEQVRLTLGRFLALALEFQLGSDILGTAVSPTFDEIGKLGAIATIRTLLNFFLSRELSAERQQQSSTASLQGDRYGGDVARASTP